MMVSVIIPTYKRSERLPFAIKSILNQTYNNPIEIIVVDDNGDNEYRNNTKTNIASFIENNQIRYIQNKNNLGGCGARNVGAQIASGFYITFLDDDDFYEPTKIQEQVDFLKNNPSYDACMCNMFREDEHKRKIISEENNARGKNLKEAILNGNLFTSMLLLKKEVFLKLKGFSEIPRFQDKYFHYKLLNNGFSIGIISKPLLTLVEHNDNRISSTSIEKVVKALDILHAFEISQKTIFSKKEWTTIQYRHLYNNAYILSTGNFLQKMRGFFFIARALPKWNGNLKLGKLLLKTMTPNFILKLK